MEGITSHVVLRDRLQALAELFRSTIEISKDMVRFASLRVVQSNSFYCNLRRNLLYIHDEYVIQDNKSRVLDIRIDRDSRFKYILYAILKYKYN